MAFKELFDQEILAEQASTSPVARAKEAGISPTIAKWAEQLLPIQARTARALADALSKAYAREIKPSEIEELQIL